MKNIEKFLYHSTAYTVVISLMFFLFAKLSHLESLEISFGRYFLIFAFSLVISASEYIFVVKKIPVIFQYLIHYAVLCISFFFVFMSVRDSSGISEFSAATVFASVIIFSAVYFLILGCVILYKKTISKTRTKKQKPATKNEYKSRFN